MLRALGDWEKIRAVARSSGRKSHISRRTRAAYRAASITAATKPLSRLRCAPRCDGASRPCDCKAAKSTLHSSSVAYARPTRWEAVSSLISLRSCAIELSRALVVFYLGCKASPAYPSFFDTSRMPALFRPLMIDTAFSVIGIPAATQRPSDGDTVLCISCKSEKWYANWRILSPDEGNEACLDSGARRPENLVWRLASRCLHVESRCAFSSVAKLRNNNVSKRWLRLRAER